MSTTQKHTPTQPFRALLAVPDGDWSGAEIVRTEADRAALVASWRAGPADDGCGLDFYALADLPELVEVLRDILSNQLTGNVDLDAPRFVRARALLEKIGGQS